MSDMEIEKEIADYLVMHPPVRTEQLIEHLLEIHIHERGYSRKTLYRKIKQMADAGDLARIGQDEYESFGITEPDKRAQYITLRSSSERKKHLDDLFSHLTSKSTLNVKMVLDEIKRYQGKYTLNPHQLDALSAILTKDNEIDAQALPILYDYIERRGIKPSKTDEFLQKLRKLTDIYRSDSPQKEVRRKALRLLGRYNDDGVIRQLQYDIENSDPDTFTSLKEDYKTEYTARVIEAHRNDLFHLQESLIRKGQDKLAAMLAEIRTFAVENENAPLEYKDPINAMNSPANPVFTKRIPIPGRKHP